MKQTIPYLLAKQISKEIKRRLKFSLPIKLKIVGSILRKEPFIHDIDFLVILPKVGEYNLELHLLPKRLNDKIINFKFIKRGAMHSQIIFYTLYNSYKVDFFTTTKQDYPFALYHYTGPKNYNIRSRMQAKRHGLLLNQYGLYNISTGIRINHKFKTEKEIMKYLGLTYRTPENRK